MALTDRTPTGADTAGWVPELWAQKTIDEAEKNLVCFDAVDHQWTVGKNRGDTINLPLTNHVTASEVVVGSKAASLDIGTGTKLQLVMNQWFEAPIDIDSMTFHQTQIPWQAKARREAAYAIQVKVDTSIATLFSALTGSSVYGADGQMLTDDILLYLMETLDEADVPKVTADRSIITDPSGLVDILKIDKLVAEQYTKKGSIDNGNIGNSVYGCTVRITNNLVAATTGSYGVMLHREAIASAIQINTPWQEEYKELHQVRTQHEALWGNKETRDTWGIAFYTRKA